ncbi:hypothetical protein QVD99_000916 [Batrachochytrium dendrobatidis]|nr:hypothetical protein O5D80_003767 [Batrachochytrium dendrobatidis]KAK5673472.1 hypothetical protein QVD99_000916 [Batrachochytrium dendrobatidis]
MANTPLRRRRIRQEPFMTRLVTFPLDWLMLMGEWWANIDQEQLFANSSFLIALLLNVLYLLVKMYRDGVLDDAEELRALSKSSYLELSLDSNSFALFMQWLGLKISSHMLFTVIEFVLILVCVLNTIHVFTRTKSFILFKQPTKPRYPSDNQWMIRSRNAQIRQVDVAQPVTTDNQSSHTQWTNLFSSKKPQSKSGLNSTTQHRQDDSLDASDLLSKKSQPYKEDRWVIQVWNPSEGSLNLFCWFSPPQIAVMYGANVSNWYYYIPVACLTALIMYFLVSLFNDRLQDQQILSGQLLHEFTESFVYQQYPLKPDSNTAMENDSDDSKSDALFDSNGTELHY